MITIPALYLWFWIIDRVAMVIGASILYEWLT